MCSGDDINQIRMLVGLKMSTAPPAPPRPYDAPLNSPPLPPLLPDILEQYITESGSLPHFEKPLIAPTPHHGLRIRWTLADVLHISALVDVDSENRSMCAVNPSRLSPTLAHFQ